MFSRIAKNAKLGDGCVSKQSSSINANLSFVSTDIEVLKLKKQMCDGEGIVSRNFGTQASGYGGTKTIYNFHTRVNEKITAVYYANFSDLIATIDKEDLFLWLVDDGSWHKNQRLFHLYCNMFNDEETNELIDKIGELYGVKPRMRKDRKRDGREFNYLYFPRRLTVLVRPEFKRYLVEKNLPSMFYKFGGEAYTDPLEQLSNEVILSPIYPTISKVYATARRFDDSVIFSEDPNQVLITWNSAKGPNSRTILKEAS